MAEGTNCDQAITWTNVDLPLARSTREIPILIKSDFHINIVQLSNEAPK